MNIPDTEFDTVVAAVVEAIEARQTDNGYYEPGMPQIATNRKVILRYEKLLETIRNSN